MLCSLRDNAYLPPGYADQPLPDGHIAQGLWRFEQNLPNLQRAPRGHAVSAGNVRDMFASWCSKKNTYKRKSCIFFYCRGDEDDTASTAEKYNTINTGNMAIFSHIDL